MATNSGTTTRQRHPLWAVCLGRRRTRHGQAGQELGSRPGPCQRLAGRACTGLPRLARRQDPFDPDHPQPRLSGTLPEGSLRRIGAPESPSTSTASSSTTSSPSSRAASFRLAPHHRQRDLRARDHHQRSRLWDGRIAADAIRRGGAHRDSQRHRRELGPPQLCTALAQFGAGDWVGKNANADYVRKHFGLAVSRGPISRGRTACAPEGCRSRSVRRRRDHRGRRTDRGNRHRRAAFEQALVDAHRRRPEPSGSPLASTTGRRADFCRQRFYIDAVALRALRPEPDVRATFRLAADRPPDRRSRRNHPRRRDRLPVFKPSAKSFLGGVRRAFEAFGAKDRLDAMRRSAMARSFSWDLSAACYNALYRKTVAPSISVCRDYSAASGMISICSWRTTPESGSNSPIQGLRSSTAFVWR